MRLFLIYVNCLLSYIYYKQFSCYNLFIMKLSFYGANESVTGSNFLLESNGSKILIDCGLKQGSNFAEEFNFEPFPYDLSEIDGVFITHAHIDHTGRLPKLAGEGFKGKVFSTAPTKDFSEYLLQDSINILSREADRCNSESFCNPDNISKILNQWETVDYYNSFDFGPFTITFYNAGHILGSSFIKIEAEGKSIVFSGDLGNSPAPLLPNREKLSEAGDVDYCVMESTYGDRVHESRSDADKILDEVITRTVNKNGVLMIPAFAMERTQDLLFHIHRLIDKEEIEEIPVFLDSPLAIDLTDVYEKYSKWLNKETKEFQSSGHPLFNFSALTETETVGESKNINKSPAPKIIIAGSGMSTGGRILHHEMRYLSDPKNSILFVGYQVEGSLGRKILDSHKEEGDTSVEIFGNNIPVNCNIRAIGGYSAHADKQQLLNWIDGTEDNLKQIFIVHGEKEQSNKLSKTIEDKFGTESIVPEYGSSVEL